MWLGLVWGYGPLSFLHPFQGPLRLAPQSFTYNLKLRDWRRIEVENFDAFIYFTWFLDFSLFPSFYKFPNSTGQVYEVQFGTATNALGIFQIVSSWNNNISGGSEIYTEKMSSIGIDMSLSNTIYGKSSTVQPSALRSLCLIRSY